MHDQYEGNFRDLYIEYLKKLSQHTSNRISDGANYRLFKEEVNSGNFESANIYRNILENSLKKIII